MDQYENWLAAWFSKRVELPEKYRDKNFFTEEWIDSFGIIELITDIEQQFNITFTQEHFQDRRFSSIAGLIEIIELIQKD